MKLSIIIVHYNVADLLRNCLASIEKYAGGVSHEVIVVDNASPNESWKRLRYEFPQIIFIENKENLGFANANNLGTQRAKGDYLLFLNPDTELEDTRLPEIIHFADSQYNFGCLGVQMHDARGNFLPESKRCVPNPWNSFEKLFFPFKDNQQKNYYRFDIEKNAVAAVDVVTGAFLLIKKEIYEDVGSFDERYFMYGEDIDLCYTLLRNGRINYYYGAMQILHHKGESTTKDEKYLERFYGAMEIFVKKYYTKIPFVKYFLIAGLRLKHRIELKKIAKKMAT